MPHNYLSQSNHDSADHIDSEGFLLSILFNSIFQTTESQFSGNIMWGCFFFFSFVLLSFLILPPVFFSFLFFIAGNWSWRRSWLECCGGFGGRTFNLRAPINTTSELAVGSPCHRYEIKQCCCKHTFTYWHCGKKKKKDKNLQMRRK